MRIEARIESAGYDMGSVLRELEFEFAGPGMLLVVGRNGAGKTTLLRTLFGLIPHMDGIVRMAGVNPFQVTADALARSGNTFMPQDGGVFDTLTVEENLQLTRSREAAETILGILPGWTQKMRQRAGTLSGGERKILGLARAVGQRPSILLVDEPTEGVWHELLPAITEHLAELARESLVVVVEQNLANFLQVADHVIVLEQGSIALQGVPSVVATDPALESLLTL